MGKWAKSLHTIRYYYDQKSILTAQRQQSDAPCLTIRQKMIDEEAERLLQEKPSRSLRNYPFHGMAEINLRNNHQLDWIDQAVTTHWKKYFNEKDQLLNAATETLTEDGAPFVAKALNAYETVKLNWAAKADGRIARALGHDVIQQQSQQKKKEGPMTNLFNAYLEFREQKKELKEKYVETIAPLKEQRREIFEEELSLLTTADPTLEIPREDFSLTYGLFAVLKEAGKETTKRAVAIDEQLEQKKAAHQFAVNRLRVETANQLGLSDLAVNVLKGVNGISQKLKLAA